MQSRRPRPLRRDRVSARSEWRSLHSLALWAAALLQLVCGLGIPGARRRHAGVLWKTDDSLLAVPPVTTPRRNNPLIHCYLSGCSWVLTEEPNTLRLAEHNLSWEAVMAAAVIGADLQTPSATVSIPFHHLDFNLGTTALTFSAIFPFTCNSERVAAKCFPVSTCCLPE